MRAENSPREAAEADCKPTSAGLLRHKRAVFEAFPSRSFARPPRTPKFSASRHKAQRDLQQIPFGETDQPLNATNDANTTITTGAATSAAAPWDSNVREGLDFCRDGEALLLQLRQRIRDTGEQLVAACGATMVYGEKEKETERREAENETPKKMEQQQLLEEEVDECLVEIGELRRLLGAVESFAKTNILVSTAEAEKTTTSDSDKAWGLRGEATSKVLKLFCLHQVIESGAAAPASTMIGVIRGIKRFVAALAERIHNVENSASVWLTHGGEVIPYLQHLKRSLRDLKTQHQNSTEKRQELAARVAQKRQQAETIRFRLEKTQDEFRLARIDLTRDELEKVSGKERMQLLESRREALDTELKSLAAFSPLFIVERAAKYITLQYRPENSSIDHEISVEGLDLSFTRGVTHISPFFSVHVQPPNNRVRLLLESGIGDLLQRLSSGSVTLKSQNPGAREQGGRGIHAADDVVVDHIAAVLIKTLSSSFTTPNLPPLYVPLKSACQTIEA